MKPLRNFQKYGRLVNLQDNLHRKTKHVLEHMKSVHNVTSLRSDAASINESLNAYSGESKCVILV